MIKSLIVKGLNQKFDFDLQFHSDLNIFTGKNGCGKTTLLKLLWYLNSGNLSQLFKEISFDYLKFSADSVEVEFTISTKEDKKYVEGFYEGFGKLTLNMFLIGNPIEFESNEEKNIFFPTFRRIEGGFSIEKDNTLSVALNELSRGFKYRYNLFVAAISTNDINELLHKKYTLCLEETKLLEDYQSATILEKLKNKNGNDSNVLQEIETLVKDTENQKETILKPFTVLSQLIHEIFTEKKIEVTQTLNLGQAENAISSDKLSAGEKQMLSFLCYNFFSSKTSIFIDEPELSLHTDWQRILFPTLLEQGTDNQFFVATHSPFIYSKYPDKEHILDLDKGGEQ